mgnify:FL=1
MFPENKLDAYVYPVGTGEELAVSYDCTIAYCWYRLYFYEFVDGFNTQRKKTYTREVKTENPETCSEKISENLALHFLIPKTMSELKHKTTRFISFFLRTSSRLEMRQ